MSKHHLSGVTGRKAKPPFALSCFPLRQLKFVISTFYRARAVVRLCSKIEFSSQAYISLVLAKLKGQIDPLIAINSNQDSLAKEFQMVQCA